MILHDPNIPDRYVREKEASILLAVSPSTLRRLERRGDLPGRRAISSNTRGWLLSDIRAFIEGRVVATKKEAGTSA